MPDYCTHAIIVYSNNRADFVLRDTSKTELDNHQITQ